MTQTEEKSALISVENIAKFITIVLALIRFLRKVLNKVSYSQLNGWRMKTPIIVISHLVIYFVIYWTSIIVVRVISYDFKGSKTPPTVLTPPPYQESDDSLMVLIEGGTFQMGCTNEQYNDCDNKETPVHDVTLESFLIGKYEVTQAEWYAVMGSNPSKNKCDKCPVENISWKQIQDFINKLNVQKKKSYRLPTEAEWEYAARGGKHSAKGKFINLNLKNDVAWYSENSGTTTHPVGMKLKNELGLHDMCGNVGEWCSDWWGTGAKKGTLRVYRGGNYLSSARSCRVTYRFGEDISKTYYHIGFRLAMSIK